MIKLYDHNFKREDVKNVKPGDVIVYNGCMGETYFLVSDVKNDGSKISGRITSARGVNGLPLEAVVEGSNH